MDRIEQTDSNENTPSASSALKAKEGIEKQNSQIKIAVDLIIDMGAGMILLVKRKFQPLGWALPGGFLEVGESAEQAALREAFEETGLRVELVRQFHVYSDPSRDPRGPCVSVVFLARGWGTPKAGDDAVSCEAFHEMNLPGELAFDHRQIIRDYYLERY